MIGLFVPLLRTLLLLAAPVTPQSSPVDSLAPALPRAAADSTFRAETTLARLPGQEPSSARFLPPPGARYVTEEVRVRPREPYSLGGTLTLPWRPPYLGRRTFRFPVVIFITGAGAQNRDGTPAELLTRPAAGSYRPFYEIADTLARLGIASVRVDDRGVESSTGSLDSTDTYDLAGDTRAALEYVRRRVDLDPARIALLGIGEGASIAGIVGRFETSLAGVVLMAGPAAPGRRVVEWRIRSEADADSTLTPTQRDSVITTRLTAWDARAARESWARFFGSYDPLISAGLLRNPVLVLQGDADTSIPTESAEQLAQAIRTGGNGDVTVRRFPGLGHDFLPVPAPGSLATPGGILPREVLGAVAGWLSGRLRPTPEPPRPSIRRGTAPVPPAPGRRNRQR